METRPVCMGWKTEHCWSAWTPRANHRVSAIPVKIPMPFFTDREKPILKFPRISGTLNSKAIWQKNRAGGLTLPDFQTCYSNQHGAVLTWRQTHRPWERRAQKRTLTDIKWFSAGCQDHSVGGKGSLFNKWCRENWISTCQRIQLGPSFTPYLFTQNGSKT